MNIFLWSVQGSLGAIFLSNGVVKLAVAKQRLERMRGFGYVIERTSLQMKLIGAAEVSAAAGLVLPLAYPAAAAAAPLAAAGLTVLMVGAVRIHRDRKESAVLPMVLALCSALVAVARFGFGVV